MRRVHLDFIQPDIGRLVVLVKHRNPQSARWNLHHAGEELPGISNGLALEVITKTEITQHFKKGMVTCGIPDVFEVIVLATGTYAALTAGGPFIGALFLAQEYILERHHAGVHE